MRTSDDAQVIIVGSGPAGTSTAVALARAGVDVCLLDRAHFPRDKPCAEYLSPQAGRVLDAMGALTTVEAAGGAQLSGMIVRAPNGVEMRGDFAAQHGFCGFRDKGLALKRHVLDAILLNAARAAGARVAEGVRVTGLGRDANGRITGVVTLDADGRRGVRRAALVVGADGLRSVVARALGVQHAARWPRRIAFVTHYRGVQGIGASGEMHVERAGYCGLADVGGGETNVAIVVPHVAARGAAGDASGFFDRWIAAVPHLAARFRNAMRTSPVRVTGPFASAARRAWAPGAALVGDAADFFDPFTGEGIYAALRGGELLAPFAMDAARSRGADADAALTAYASARRLEFSGKWRVERLVGAAVSFPSLMNRAARVLGRRKELADLFVGVAGDFVPPREILRPRVLLHFLWP